MLKLNASYSKKVPAELEFSSKSYHVSLEVELPAGMTADQLQAKISETFALARDSVEAEIHSSGTKVIDTTPSQAPRQLPARANGRGSGRSSNEPASNKQVAFLTDLLKKGGYDLQATCQNYGVQSLYDLTRKQCSDVIDGLQTKAA